MTHHERWDGTGYPRGLAQEEIPLESRIVALADVYDALHSIRPYKRAYAEGEILRNIKEEAGQHFDPAVYRAFENSSDEIKSIRNQFSDEVNTTHMKRILSLDYETMVL